MADTTWSVRLTDEVREKLTSMIEESGLNSKDFLTQLLQSAELHSLQQNQPLIAGDIEEIMAITGRMQSILLNIAERFETFKQSKMDEMAVVLEDNQRQQTLQLQRITELETWAKEMELKNASLQEQLEEQEALNNQLSETNAAQKALVVEYREKNDTLTGLIGDAEEYRKTIADLIKELDTEKSAKREVEHLRQVAEDDRKRLQLQLKEQQERFDFLLVQGREKIELEKERELLDLRKAHQAELEELHREYMERVSSLLTVADKPAE